MSSGLLVQGEQGAPDPDERPAFGGAEGLAVDGPDIARSIPMAGMGAIPDDFPGRSVGLDRLAKMRILVPRAGHHGHEASAGAIDVGEIVVAAELGVGDVQEVRASGYG